MPPYSSCKYINARRNKEMGFRISLTQLFCTFSLCECENCCLLSSQVLNFNVSGVQTEQSRSVTGSKREGVCHVTMVKYGHLYIHCLPFIPQSASNFKGWVELSHLFSTTTFTKGKTLYFLLSNKFKLTIYLCTNSTNSYFRILSRRLN